MKARKDYPVIAQVADDANIIVLEGIPKVAGLAGE
jgi:hypothetical protein